MSTEVRRGALHGGEHGRFASSECIDHKDYVFHRLPGRPRRQVDHIHVVKTPAFEEPVKVGGRYHEEIGGVASGAVACPSDVVNFGVDTLPLGDRATWNQRPLVVEPGGV